MSTTEPSPLAPIYGGEEVIVLFRDGSNRRVFIREYTIRNFSDFIRVADNEPALLEAGCSLLTDTGLAPLTAEQVDAIAPEGLVELVEKSRALNLAPALAWAERQARVLRRLNPVLEKFRVS